jgi:hypothetical protein
MIEINEQNQGVNSLEKFPWTQWTVFEPGNPAHENLVFGTWKKHIKSFKEYRRMGKLEFANQRKIFGDIVKRCPPVIVHSLKGEPLFGFICSEIQDVSYGDRQVLHFLYIRNMWRRRGLANLLMKISFPKWKIDSIYYPYPMTAVKYFADKWLLYRKRNAVFNE